jgi:glyoxylate/hydroxypyruvate reductase A
MRSHQHLSLTAIVISSLSDYRIADKQRWDIACEEPVRANGQRGTILFYSEASHPSWPAELQRAFPAFAVRTRPEDVDPEDVVAVIVWKYPAGMLQRFANLRLIQVLGAGVDHLWSDPCLPKRVPIARLVDPGLTARMTEYVLLHSLALHRRMPELRSAQTEHTWHYMHPKPLAETCVGVMGIGVLGRSCVAALTTVGFTAIGWSRSRKTDVGVPSYIGAADLDEFKRRADVIVLLLPLTRATENLIDATFLASIRDGAALINVGRGALIVDDALVAALDAGRLRHAVLDVFRTEPLPAGHAFWSHPKITITPHNSSATNPATALGQIVENVHRAMAGEKLLNPVDPMIGY